MKMAVNSSHPLTLHSRGAGKCLHSSMIVDRLGRGATTADAPMSPSVGNVILIVLDHVVGAAPGRPREKGGCKEPVPSEPLPSPSPRQLHLRVRTATLPGRPSGLPASSSSAWNIPFPTSGHGHASSILAPSPARPPLRPPHT